MYTVNKPALVCPEHVFSILGMCVKYTESYWKEAETSLVNKTNSDGLSEVSMFVNVELNTLPRVKNNSSVL